LERLGGLSEEAVRFYTAQIASALAYLHSKRIIHRWAASRLFKMSTTWHTCRDLKPDNILLDEKGNAHLTDFNIGVHFPERRLLMGVAGSMAYMAPEILAKRGYTYTIDWWSLGVCAYELVFGRRPFRGKTNADLTHAIAKDRLRFPEDAESRCSRQGMQVLQGFLDRDTTRRLGCRPNGEGFEDLKQLAWFSSINWDALEAKESISPFIPDVSILPFLCLLLDAKQAPQSKKANFDASHELEELLLEDNPLKAKQRKQNQDINSLSSEMRQMEEQ
jgi:serine/threonine kinase 32